MHNPSFSQTLEYTFGIGSTSNDVGEDVAVDSNGNLVVTGRINATADFDPGAGIYELPSAGGDDIFIAKYDPSGAFLWAVSMGSTSRDYGHAVSIDENDNVIVTGNFSGTVDFDPGAGTFNLTAVGSEDIFVLKLDPNGNFLWVFNIGSTETDGAHDIATGPGGFVYATGSFAETADFDPGAGTFNLTSNGQLDFYLAKYDPDGNFVWAFSNQTGEANQRGWGINVDGFGNSYISGWFKNNPDVDPGSEVFELPNNGKSDAWVAKYDTDGNLLWAFSMGAESRDHAFKNAVDADGNVYVAGNFRNTVDFDPGTGEHLLTTLAPQEAYYAKYDADGNLLWAHHAIHATSTGESQNLAVAVDGAGNGIFTGLYDGTIDLDPGPGVLELTGEGNEAYAVSYSPTGELNWAISFDGDGNEVGRNIAADLNNNVYVTGEFRDFVDMGVDGGDSEILTSVGLADVYVAKYSTSSNIPPTAGFTFTENELTIEFDATSSTDDGSIIDWSWDFGDGNTGSGELTSHTYAEPGIYTVVLTVTDDEGATDTNTQTVDVGNSLPVASFTAAQASGTLEVSFDGSGSTDDGNIVDWSWDFGDGNMGSGEMTTHTYSNTGIFTVILTVTDDLGATGSTSAEVEIAENQDPIAAFTFTQVGGTLAVDFDGSGSTDEGTIVSWDWDFGDSNSGAGETVSHTYAVAGTYTVMLTVTDDLGAIGSLAQDVEVTDASAGTMHVASITTVINRDGGPGVAESTVLILDQDENPVEGATVLGTFSEDLSGTASAVTNENGEALLISEEFSQRARDLGICIDDVTHATLVYDSALNADASFACTSATPQTSIAKDVGDPFKKAKIATDEPTVPMEFALKRNYPNPFNPTTNISFDLPEAASVSLEVYDMMGRRVATLVNGELGAGSYETVWNARKRSSGCEWCLHLPHSSAVPGSETDGMKFKKGYRCSALFFVFGFSFVSSSSGT